MFPLPPRCLKNGNDTLPLVLAPRVSTCEQKARERSEKEHGNDIGQYRFWLSGRNIGMGVDKSIKKAGRK